MSATVIDALIITLGLDPASLNKEQQAAVKKLNELDKAADKTEKSVGKIDKSSKKTAESIHGLSRTVTSFLAIIGGTVAIKSFVQDFIDTNAQLDRLSKNLGIGVSTISAWGNASEKLGGSAQGLQGTFDMLSKAQTQLMLTGESALVPYLSALGVSLAGVNGQARPVTDILFDLSDRFSHLDRTTANNLGRMLGIDQGTMNLLLQGRKELELEIARQKEQTAVTKEQAAQAQKFQTQIVGLKQQFQALGRTLLMDAAPYIEKVLMLFERFGSWAQSHQQFIEDFLKVLAVGLAGIALATAPINLTVVAVLALAAAIALLWDDYQTWKKGGDSLIDWGKWEPGINAAINGLQKLRNAFFFVEQGMREIKDIATGNWADFAKQAAKNPDSDVVNSPLAEKARNLFRRNPSSPVNSLLLGNAIAHQEGFYDKGKTLNRPQRNHNPGDLEYTPFAIKHGAVGSDGRFAIFPDDKTGMAALTALLDSKSYAGLSTEGKINRFAPPKENNTGAYLAGINKTLAMSGIPGAASIANVPAGLAGGNTTVDKSVKTDIGTLVVNTQATDANGIVADMERSLDYLFVSQANYGVTP